MKFDWLQRRAGARGVIVAFNGWGMETRLWARLKTGADVLVVSDYRSLDKDLPDLTGYETRELVAWSFGVAAYAAWQAGRADPFGRKVALCGGIPPVDRLKGIAPQVVRLTLDTLSEASFQTFLSRCHGTEQPAATVDIAALGAELAAILNRDHGDAPRGWDRVWIAAQDRIFPHANLMRAWEGSGAEIRVVDAPHVPFAHWEHFDEVLA